MDTLHSEAMQLAAAAKDAAPILARADGGRRNAALCQMAERLRKDASLIYEANRADLEDGRATGLSAALLDRLTVNEKRLEAMAAGIEQIAALPDPIGQVLDGWVRPNGLRISRVRTPLGVILIVFESRPNVTVDAAGLCIKSGNAVILRGGKEALRTNIALGTLLSDALREVGLPAQAVQVVSSPDRGLVPALLALEGYIDLAIPRGGKSLIQTVMEYARMPILKHLDGICHVYIDAAADLTMGQEIVLNAKTQRPGVCNAMETLLVHKEIAEAFLPACCRALREAGVRMKGDEETRRICAEEPIEPICEEDWRTEYLDLILNIGVVKDLDHAIRHINTYGSHHTDAIVTRDIDAATRFKEEVDSSSVMVNVSTRFSDGFEYGLGAEIGISTDKFHARGPVGLEGLTTYKWIVEGEGYLRE